MQNYKNSGLDNLGSYHYLCGYMCILSHPGSQFSIHLVGLKLILGDSEPGLLYGGPPFLADSQLPPLSCSGLHRVGPELEGYRWETYLQVSGLIHLGRILPGDVTTVLLYHGCDMRMAWPGIRFQVCTEWLLVRFLFRMIAIPAAFGQFGCKLPYGFRRCYLGFLPHG